MAGLREKAKRNYDDARRAWGRLNKKRVFMVLGGFLGVVALVSAGIYQTVGSADTPGQVASEESPPPQAEASPKALAASATLVNTGGLGAFHMPPLNKRNGFVFNYYKVTEGEVVKNEFLSTILDRHGVHAAEIDRIDRIARELENPPLLIPGKAYQILANAETGKAEHFIYEPDAYRYYVYTFTDPMGVKEVMRPVDRKVVTSSGVITSSLWNAIVGNGMSFAIASKMEDAFQWSVDFHHIQKNDKFRLVYEEDWIEGEKVGVGKLIAAHFNHFGKDYYAVRFKNDNYDGFFDPEGRPMKKTFLKAPVKYARISSKFNLKRFHPVLKRVKPHLGTDYAAPYGTPIMAVAAGTIERIGRTRGNGKFIKIKHDKTYATQYLHMQKFAKGMSKGARVQQGQTIGYVGSTGLATGPHVCFRFWKNGKQVNPKKQNLPPPKPIPAEDMADFVQVKDKWMAELDKVTFQDAAPESKDANNP